MFKKIRSKKDLAVILSKLGSFSEVKPRLEQYQTDSEIASELLWLLQLEEKIFGKIVVDLGCGNGIFGVGSLLLGAEKVFFVDKDSAAIEVVKKNCSSLKLRNSELFLGDVSDFFCESKVDVVIQNPPFGVQLRNADRKFLDKAMEISDEIYSFHKIESENFLRKYCEGWEVEKIFDFDFVLKRSMEFHTKEKYKVRVGMFRIVKGKL